MHLSTLESATHTIGASAHHGDDAIHSQYRKANKVLSKKSCLKACDDHSQILLKKPVGIDLTSASLGPCSHTCLS